MKIIFKNGKETDIINVSINTVNEVEHLTILFTKNATTFDELKEVYLNTDILEEILLVEEKEEKTLENLLTGFVEPVRLVFENNRFEMTLRKLKLEEVLIRDILKNKTY